MNRNPRRWWILVVLCLSTLVLVIDNMALNVAIPPLTEDLGASAQDIQWILDSYILVFAGLLLTAGSLSDRFGRRRLMIIGLALFGVASLAATLADSAGMLIAARTVMGVGGALVLPSTLSILITVFDEDERPKAMAAWGVVSMVGLVGGPILGGVLIAHFWWGAVFLINVPIAALSILAAATLMPESRGPWRKPDPLGMVLSATGMVALVWTIIEFPKNGLDAHTLIGGAATVATLVGFVVWEIRVESPMVPLHLFRDRDFAGGSLSLTLVQIGNGGLLLALTQYLQFVLGYSPMKTGLSFIPIAVAALVFNGVGAGLVGKLGNRITAVTGLLVVAAGFGMLAGLAPGDGYWPVAIGLFLMGAGSGLAMPATIGALMGAVPAEHAGVGSALNDTIQQAGAALGVALLGTALTSAYGAAMPDGAPEQARRSIGDALAVAARTGDASLVHEARDAFTTAMGTTFLASLTGVVAASVLALFVLRGRTAPDTDADTTTVPATATATATADDTIGAANADLEITTFEASTENPSPVRKS
ncbi:MFS transporter [Actinomadura harenae]|uniref:DHA2 family efflux MFS transporter permease subunit n=1 Tax=Actinomadura harenae TaxID=2483351 RepID=A0A3M2LWP3_9ACTN|nr:MFS transporter [Actinomadura harenae]RMI41964.1 DHA2 family efflux MFS transporter permease subunit [Actinomadura harenae]